MNYVKRYKLKDGNVILNQELQFKFYIEEIFWKIKMKMKGYEIEKVE